MRPRHPVPVSSTGRMRKANQEITDPAIIDEILSRSVICRIAMNDHEVPYLLPFNYGYRDRSIYIHSAASGKKIDLLKRDSRVCFEIELTAKVIEDAHACRWATLYRSVVGYGNVEIMTGKSEKIKALEIIMSHHRASGPHEFEAGQLRSMVVLKLTIDKLTGKQSGNWDRLIGRLCG